MNHAPDAEKLLSPSRLPPLPSRMWKTWRSPFSSTIVNSGAELLGSRVTSKCDAGPCRHLEMFCGLLDVCSVPQSRLRLATQSRTHYRDSSRNLGASGFCACFWGRLNSRL